MGGPGGFDGGSPGFDTLPPGAGYGPGGGKGGAKILAANGVGSGAYATVSTLSPSTYHGATYGSPLLVPIVGGSGSGGTVGVPGGAGSGGGGGGGAVVIASNNRIIIGGSTSSTAPRIAANGGREQNNYAYGSGGAIRLVAPSVSGTGQYISAANNSGGGGLGRIRIDTLDRSAMQLVFQGQASVGAFMAVFPSPLPRLDILSAADTAIPESNPGPVTILLPFGSATNRTVTVQARDFGDVVPIRVVLTPENGIPLNYDTTINNTAGNNPATATVNVTVPVNTKVAVNAWTR